MVYDAFIYYTHYDLPLGNRICHLLEECGLKCWNDKRDTQGFGELTEVLASSKSFVIIGDQDGASTYRYNLIREILQIRKQQPLFLICAKTTEQMLIHGRLSYLNSGITISSSYFSYFSYEDKYYQNKEENEYLFSDFKSFEYHLLDMSQKLAVKFDALQFKHYIENVIKNKINAVVLFEQPRVFICYSKLDGKEAEKVYQVLTDSGIKCWIDTVDIPAGTSYANSIVKGLEWCNCLVLIYSKNVIDSINIPNELEVAHADHKLIIPFIIDDYKIVNEYRYYLPRKQWIDASPKSHLSIEFALEKLKSELFRNMPQID